MFPFRVRLSTFKTILLIVLCLTFYINAPFQSFESTTEYGLRAGRIQFPFGEPSGSERRLQAQRLDAVKAEFRHSWEGYKEHAWMKDELRPLSGGNLEKFCGWAATAVDTLDTLLIMGLKDEYQNTVEAIYDLKFADRDSECTVNLFETTIRHLGGLMAAYDLDGRRDGKLYGKMVEIGDVLLAGFDTHNGMPSPYYSWPKSPPRDYQTPTNYVLAALGSLDLEFSYLSQITGDLKYFKATERVSLEFHRTQNDSSIPGLWPIYIDASGEYGIQPFTSQKYTLGALSDSMYEYLPKAHLLLDRGSDASQKSVMYRDMWFKAEPMIIEHMLYRPMTVDSQDILFSGDIGGSAPDGVYLMPEAQHLACFQGGMFALAGRIFDRAEDVRIGERLTNGCVWGYESTVTGIMPEHFYTHACKNRTSCPWEEEAYNKSWTNEGAPPGLPKGFTKVHDDRYFLRPEAIESVFVMYRITGDPTWQEKGWRMFTNIRNRTRTEIAHSALRDVSTPNPTIADEMESFWLAETLKYFYLLFSDPSLVSLDDYVLNTEAHPFRLHGR